MIDWDAYVQEHATECLIDEPWGAAVDWEGAPPAENWFFVLSVGHSGSCVLSEMLSLHPAVHCANEDKTVYNLMAMFCTKAIITHKMSLLSWQNGAWSGRVKPFASETRLVTAPFVRDACEAWRKHYGRGKAIVGDKYVGYMWIEGKLAAVFPWAKYIYCVRNPLDQLSGLLNDEWPGNRALLEDPEACWGQVETYLQWQRQYRSIPTVLVVPYERFAAEDTLLREMDRVFGFLGADSEPTLADGLRPSAYAGSIGRWQRDPAIRDMVDLWRSQGRFDDAGHAAILEPGESYLEAM